MRVSCTYRLPAYVQVSITCFVDQVSEEQVQDLLVQAGEVISVQAGRVLLLGRNLCSTLHCSGPACEASARLPEARARCHSIV